MALVLESCSIFLQLEYNISTRVFLLSLNSLLLFLGWQNLFFQSEGGMLSVISCTTWNQRCPLQGLSHHLSQSSELSQYPLGPTRASETPLPVSGQSVQTVTTFSTFPSGAKGLHPETAAVTVLPPQSVTPATPVGKTLQPERPV